MVTASAVHTHWDTQENCEINQDTVIFVEVSTPHGPAAQDSYELEVGKVALPHRSSSGWVQGAAVWRGGGASWVAVGAGYGSCLERRSRSRKRTSEFA